MVLLAVLLAGSDSYVVCLDHQKRTRAYVKMGTTSTPLVFFFFAGRNMELFDIHLGLFFASVCGCRRYSTTIVRKERKSWHGKKKAKHVPIAHPQKVMCKTFFR